VKEQVCIQSNITVPAEDVLRLEAAIVVDEDVDEDLCVVADLQQTVEHHSLGLRRAVVALQNPQEDLGEVDRNLILRIQLYKQQAVAGESQSRGKGTSKQK
jgi:hypothetical protein